MFGFFISSVIFYQDGKRSWLKSNAVCKDCTMPLSVTVWPENFSSVYARRYFSGCSVTP